jgi:hypothetical protein
VYKRYSLCTAEAGFMLGNFSITVTDDIVAKDWEWFINANYSASSQLQEFADSLQAKSWNLKELNSFIKLKQVEWKLDGVEISIKRKKKKKK